MSKLSMLMGMRVILRFQFQQLYVNNNHKSSVIRVLQNLIMPYYAVARGRTSGIYMTWGDCEAQVKGFSGARYKKFDSVASAENFIKTEGGASVAPKRSSYNNQSNKSSSYNQPKYTGSNYNQKRSYTTTASNNSKYIPKNIPRNTREATESDYSDEDTQSDGSDDLNMMITKQLDDIEKRVNSFEKGIDKIIKKNTSKGSGKKSILIEPPQPKKRRSASGFEHDSDGYVEVYTDGACSSNGRQGARAGFGVYWGEGHHLNASEPVSGRATNNCGEIQAATHAIQQALQNGVTKLVVNTDSQFLINAVTKWMPGWKRKGWKLQSGEPVKNEKDFKELDNLQHQLQVKWNYVEAHRGIHGNEMADQLAKAGASKYSK